MYSISLHIFKFRGINTWEEVLDTGVIILPLQVLTD